MSDVVEWAGRVGSARLRNQPVEFDRASLAGEPEYEAAVRTLRVEISREIHAQAQARLAARLEKQPLLRGMLAPHRSSVVIELLVVFLAAGGAAIFLTRSGVDLEFAAPISAVLCLISAVLMAVVVLRGMGRGLQPKFTSRVTVLVAGSTIPGLGLAIATGTLNDPAFVVWWGMLATAAVIALVLLLLLARNRWAIRATVGDRLAADYDDWVAEVRTTHAASLGDAANRLGELWAAVPPARRNLIEQERAEAVDVLAERGFVDQAAALRGAVPGALELDLTIANTSMAWGAGSSLMTSARIVPVVDARAAAAG